MSIIHIILFPFFILLPILIAYYYRSFYLEDSTDKFFFLSGFLLKMFGAIVAYFIYTVYYKGGDTTSYFESGSGLADFILDHPSKTFEVLSIPVLGNYKDFDFLPYAANIVYKNDAKSFIIVKIASFLSIITFKSFFYASILCSYISFYGSWQFYKLLTPRIRYFKKQLGYAIFFMPSVIFWGSGLFKDTFTLFGLNLLFVSGVEILAYRNYRLRNFVFAFVGIYLLTNIRSFFLISSLPFLIFWVVGIRYQMLPSASVRAFFIPLFFLGLVGSVYLVLSNLTSTFEELSVENLQDRAKGFQSWHTTLKGSAYSLGDIEYSTVGIVSKIPSAVNVTFFRPYFTEANKPIIFLSFLQSFMFQLIVIYFLIKTKVIYFLSFLFRSPEGIALLGFSLFFAFVVGFTSYNFGALDRYKIPCLSTFIISLVFIYDTYYHQKVLRNQQNKEG